VPRPSLPARAVIGLLAFLTLACAAHADRRTVCTITVNSDDEREVLRRTLPPADYDFVELVEHGRPDWLRSACERRVRCDVLLISGHFDGGTEFYTDRPDQREYLPVEEMERAACSESCPGVFSQLKEVYLMGCNTLNPQPMRTVPGEVTRSLVSAGASPPDAQRTADALGELYGESNRDRMRQIFKDVPVIYGFPGKAPLGRYAGPVLERYLRAGGEFGEGRVSAKLLAAFAAGGMTATPGMVDNDPRAAFREDTCRFLDERVPVERKAEHLRAVLDRGAAEVRMFFDHIERYAARLPDAASSRSMTAIAGDTDARTRFLAVARDADDPATGVRMARLAARLGWLDAAQERALVVEVLAQRFRSPALGADDVDLACTLNREGVLDGAFGGFPQGLPATAARDAVLACLGSREARDRVLRALASGDEAGATAAHAYLSRRPMADAAELRTVTADVARMNGRGDAQVKALHALARHELADRESLDALAQSFRAAKSLEVQRAIAGVLVRADLHAVAPADLAQVLRKQRMKSPDGRDVIDVLIRRLDAAASRD
jgi:hypothetical protein